MAIAPEAIHPIATSVPGVINCHAIASRGLLGRQVFIEMHLIVDASDVEIAHHITEEVESRLEERFRPVRILIQSSHQRISLRKLALKLEQCSLS